MARQSTPQSSLSNLAAAVAQAQPTIHANPYQAIPNPSR